MQKEYAQGVTIKDIAKFFHLREHDAAKHLGVSPSKVKKAVHNAGLKRWPFRKVCSSSLCLLDFHKHMRTPKCACLVTIIDISQIEAIERRTKEIISSMDPANPTKIAAAEAELQRLQRKKAEFYAPYE